MQFRLYTVRFSFVARDPIHFPAGKSSNILRGGFGLILRGLVCAPECPGARDCERRMQCPYATICEPSAGTGPSGFADAPRPFAFRATHLDGRTFLPGQGFHFGLNLFEMRRPVIEAITPAFARLAGQGFGPGRGRAELAGVDATPLALDLAPGGAVARILVRFLTPTELKGGRGLLDRPEFGVLAARVRDRLSTLRERYGSGPLDINFRAFGERAGHVRMTRCDVRRVEAARRSSRTGQTHPLGGFVGEAEYEGDLGEFVPYLRAAQWTGVGRQTVWGKGEIEPRLLG